LPDSARFSRRIPKRWGAPFHNQEVDVMSSKLFDIQLAEETLDRLLAWIPGLADPPDFEDDGRAEQGSAALGSVVPLAVSDLQFLVPPVIRHLRQRDKDFAETEESVIPAYQIVDYLSVVADTDTDLGIESGVGARIGEPDGPGSIIELGIPIDMGWFGLLPCLSLQDGVRLLTEAVRVFGNVACFARLPDSIQSNAVRVLSELVGLLRTAIRDARDHQSDEADDARDGDPGPLTQ
jgi:hypothetical protein